MDFFNTTPTYTAGEGPSKEGTSPVHTAEATMEGPAETDAALAAAVETGLSVTDATTRRTGEDNGDNAEAAPDTPSKKRKATRSGAAKRRARKAKLAVLGTTLEATQAGAPTSEKTAQGEVGPHDGQTDPSAKQGGKEGETAGKGLKRDRQTDGSTPEHSAKRKGNIFPEPSSFKEALVGGRKIAIAPSDYPESTLTPEQGDLVMRGLGEAMDAIPKGMTVPRFEECRYVQGILWITCTDAAAKQWLKEAANNLKPWEGASLQIMERECLPRLRKMATVISGPPEKTGVILQRIGRQNPDRRTQLWRVWGRREAERSVHLILGVDAESHEALSKRGFVVHVGLGRALLREFPAWTGVGGGKPGAARGAAASIPQVRAGDGPEGAGEASSAREIPSAGADPAPQDQPQTVEGRDGPTLVASQEETSGAPTGGGGDRPPTKKTIMPTRGKRGSPLKAVGLGSAGNSGTRGGVQGTTASGSLRSHFLKIAEVENKATTTVKRRGK